MGVPTSTSRPPTRSSEPSTKHAKRKRRAKFGENEQLWGWQTEKLTKRRQLRHRVAHGFAQHAAFHAAGVGNVRFCNFFLSARRQLTSTVAMSDQRSPTDRLQSFCASCARLWCENNDNIWRKWSNRERKNNSGSDQPPNATMTHSFVLPSCFGVPLGALQRSQKKISGAPKNCKIKNRHQQRRIGAATHGATRFRSVRNRQNSSGAASALRSGAKWPRQTQKLGKKAATANGRRPT